MREIIKFCMFIVVATIGIVALNSCSSGDEPNIDEKPAIVPNASMREWLNGQQDTGYEVFEQMTQMSSTENLAYSPISLYSVMSMTANGAGGNCADEFAKFLNYSDFSQLNKYNAQILSNFPYLDRKTTFKMANCILAQQTVEFNQEFLSNIFEYYNSEVIAVNPLTNNATELLNDWISSQTNGLIKVHFDGMDKIEGLCLVNALYFQSPWTNPFKKDKTQSLYFTCSDGQKVKTQIMHDFEMKGYYAEVEDVRVLTLPFGNGSYEMSFILPAEGTNLREFICKNDIKKLINSTGRVLKEVDVYLPKFEISTNTVLNDIIASMGYTEFFKENVWPKLLSTETSISIDKIRQSVYLKIDEDGGVGSSSSSVNTGFVSNEPTTNQFKADRPFFYVINERSCNVPIFMGTIEKF